ncbi:hypothetical protein RFM41_03750 [Mesorhizobium sp. VK25A]|uniref:Uncharacterized protein n=1 Tax=Mesorhizobium vachelliae TaxID=3072309 RepID=A0ABU5A2E0_9HYPH|nr:MULTISPECIES: hypothetical protein [unclassified Mesorhizobium]MDX8531415.1 hypothetical protein [Mesorhizobium sp. VK25D]MDX8542834.1 hypothetical protein [Mesorhizobium sp. VK25A]
MKTMGRAAAEPEAMNRPNLMRGDMAGLLFVAVLFAAVVLALLFFPQRAEQNFGFGPEWQCARMREGDPICVRLAESNVPNGDKRDKGASK